MRKKTMIWLTGTKQVASCTVANCTNGAVKEKSDNIM